MENRRVLVTGGAGFIGSNIVDAILQRSQAHVRVLDSFATGLRSNISHCLGSIEVVEGDIRDFETVEEAVEGVDIILHQAALPSVSRSVKAPVSTNDVNVGGTLNLLSAARKSGVKRVVFASSSSVYGDTPHLPKDESAAPSPRSPYAVAKLTGEHYCRVFSELYGMETVALRYFNVFGPRQDPASQYSGVIAKFCQCALSGTPYPVCGDGLQTRDFTFVENVVHANILAMNAGEVAGQVLNIACGTRVTVLDMIRVLNRLVGREIPVERMDARAGDVRDSQAAISRARRVLGYEPSVEFEDGLARTLSWYEAASEQG